MLSNFNNEHWRRAYIIDVSKSYIKPLVKLVIGQSVPKPYSIYIYASLLQNHYVKMLHTRYQTTRHYCDIRDGPSQNTYLGYWLKQKKSKRFLLPNRTLIFRCSSLAISYFTVPLGHLRTQLYLFT
jgi:hypothetical protein